MTVGEREAPDELVAVLGRELTVARQRGLDDLDLEAPPQKRRVDVPTLERLARRYADDEESARIPLIKALLTAALTAWEQKGHADDAEFVRRLFIASEEQKPADRRPTILLEQARTASGLNEDQFDQRRRSMFREFARHLADFVAARPPASPPSPEPPTQAASQDVSGGRGETGGTRRGRTIALWAVAVLAASAVVVAAVTPGLSTKNPPPTSVTAPSAAPVPVAELFDDFTNGLDLVNKWSLDTPQAQTRKQIYVDGGKLHLQVSPDNSAGGVNVNLVPILPDRAIKALSFKMALVSQDGPSDGAAYLIVSSRQGREQRLWMGPDGDQLPAVGYYICLQGSCTERSQSEHRQYRLAKGREYDVNVTDEGGVRFDVPGNSSAVAPTDNAPIGGFRFYLFSDAGRSFHVTVDDVRITYAAEQPPTTATSSIQASIGQNCAVDGSNAVDVDQVSRKNGQPGIGSQLYVDVKVNKPPEGGHNYWLISKITDSRAVYDAKYRIDAAIGPQRVELSLPTSGKGATRDLFVVDGDPGGSQWLQQNKDNDGDPRWDSNRLSLAGGVVKVSNACSITKTVDWP